MALKIAKMLSSCMSDQVRAPLILFRIPERGANLCQYDSDGKKWCISHHYHHDLEISNIVADTRQNTTNNNLDRSTVLSSDTKSNNLSLNFTENNESIK